jgi:hypothetical protein
MTILGATAPVECGALSAWLPRVEQGGRVERDREWLRALVRAAIEVGDRETANRAIAGDIDGRSHDITEIEAVIEKLPTRTKLLKLLESGTTNELLDFLVQFMGDELPAGWDEPFREESWQ